MSNAVAKYQKYAEYKDSGIEWLGEIPSHWKVVPCRAVVEHQTEKNTNSTSSNYLSLMANIGVIRYEDKGDIGNKKPEDLSKCKVVKKGQLVINSMNYSIGSFGMSQYDGICSPVYIVLQPISGVYSQRFALRIFENSFFQKYLSTFGNGILEHRAAINWEDIKGKYVPLPSLEEQNHILNFLDHETSKIDSLIAKQEKLIELLKEKRQAVISHAVTKGLNPDVAMKDSGVEWLGQVPEHWQKKILKYIVSQQGGGTPDKSNLSFWDGDIPWVSPKDMKVDYISTSQDKITVKAIEQSSTKLVPIGSVLMVVRGMILIHSVPVALTQEAVTINQDMKALIPNNDLDSEYFLYLLKGLKDYLLDYVETSGHGTKCLRSDDFMNMPLFLPNVEEQKNIVQYIKNKSEVFDSLINKAESAIQLMQERRTALISSAVTGKIDVRHHASRPSGNDKKQTEGI